jgi:arabinogalactan endo-1,4-beta-galactosidase
MKAAGLRVGRVRVWVDPAAGESRLEHAVSIAKLLKKYGFNFCLDLHYSDTWADPGHQSVPSGWDSSDLDSLTAEVTRYTSMVMRRFAKAGISPTWVQVGNEVTNGFLWPLGRISGNDPAEWERFARLHTAGSSVVRELSPRSRQFIHLDCGGDVERVKWWMEQARTYGVGKVDAIGLSYYAQWHGSLADLQQTVTYVASTLKLKVIIVETAYPWTTRTFGSDFLDPRRNVLLGYPLSRQGQATYVADLKRILARLPMGRGQGVWWWQNGPGNASVSDQRGNAYPGFNALGR